MWEDTISLCTLLTDWTILGLIKGHDWPTRFSPENAHGRLVLGGLLISTYEMTNAVNCCQGFRALNNSCQLPASHQQHLQLSVSIIQISQFVTTEPHHWSTRFAVIIYKSCFFLLQVFNKELVIQYILTHNQSDNYAMCVQKQKWKWALRQFHAFQLRVPLQIILSKERSATTVQVN